jgi:hypothetical protein
MPLKRQRVLYENNTLIKEYDKYYSMKTEKILKMGVQYLVIAGAVVLYQGSALEVMALLKLGVVVAVADLIVKQIVK